MVPAVDPWIRLGSRAHEMRSRSKGPRGGIGSHRGGIGSHRGGIGSHGLRHELLPVSGPVPAVAPETPRLSRHVRGSVRLRAGGGRLGAGGGTLGAGGGTLGAGGGTLGASGGTLGAGGGTLGAGGGVRGADGPLQQARLSFIGAVAEHVHLQEIDEHTRDDSYKRRNGLLLTKHQTNGKEGSEVDFRASRQIWLNSSAPLGNSEQLLSAGVCVCVCARTHLVDVAGEGRRPAPPGTRAQREGRPPRAQPP